MSSGTIVLTNNSSLVSGSATSFSSDLSAGDFIVAVIGGVTYTLPVKTVDSDLQVTLIKAYDGPSTSGAAWSAVPRDTMTSITAQLASQVSYAIRGLNLDKNNWQQVLTGTGTVSVNLPDGQTYTGPAWNNAASKGSNSDITSLNGLTTALSVGQGGTGATNPSGARESLELGSAALVNTGSGDNDIPLMSAFKSIKDASGVQYLPGGLILQWGEIAVGNGVYYAQFPVRYPNAALFGMVSLACDSDASGATIWKMPAEWSVGSLKIQVSGLNIVSSASWFSIGY